MMMSLAPGAVYALSPLAMGSNKTRDTTAKPCYTADAPKCIN